MSKERHVKQLFKILYSMCGYFVVRDVGHVSLLCHVFLNENVRVTVEGFDLKKSICFLPC